MKGSLGYPVNCRVEKDFTARDITWGNLCELCFGTFRLGVVAVPNHHESMKARIASCYLIKNRSHGCRLYLLNKETEARGSGEQGNDANAYGRKSEGQHLAQLRLRSLFHLHSEALSSLHASFTATIQKKVPYQQTGEDNLC